MGIVVMLCWTARGNTNVVKRFSNVWPNSQTMDAVTTTSSDWKVKRVNCAQTGYGYDIFRQPQVNENMIYPRREQAWNFL